MKKRKIPVLLLALVLTVVFGLQFNAAKTADASSTAVTNMSAELTKLYSYLDDVDKLNISTAKANIVTMSDAAWDGILNGSATSPGVLLTPQILAKYSNDAVAARNELKHFISDLMTIVYDGNNSTNLTNDLLAFKAEHTATFQKIFGTTVSIDNLYNLFIDGKTALPTVVGRNKTLYLNNLAYGTKTQLIDTLPTLLKDATQEATSMPNSVELNGLLSTVGLTTDVLVDKMLDVLDVVDPQHDALLSVGKAIIRSQSELTANIASATGSAVTIDGSQNPTVIYSLKIMGNEATSLVKWESSNTSVAAIDVDGIVTLKADGTAKVSISRKATDATAATDWIVRPITITVTGLNPIHGDAVTLTAGKGLARPDLIAGAKYVSIPVSIDSVSYAKLNGFSMDIIYNPAKASFNSIVASTTDGKNGVAVPTTVGSVVNIDATHAKVNVSWSGSPSTIAYATSKGYLFKVKLMVTSGFVAADASTSVTVENANLTLTSGDSNNFTAVAGNVYFGMYGDVNQDGAINSTDAAQVNRKALNKSPNAVGTDEVRFLAADVDQSGVINSTDSAQINRQALNKSPNSIKTNFGY